MTTPTDPDYECARPTVSFHAHCTQKERNAILEDIRQWFVANGISVPPRLSECHRGYVPIEFVDEPTRKSPCAWAGVEAARQGRLDVLSWLSKCTGYVTLDGPEFMEVALKNERWNVARWIGTNLLYKPGRPPCPNTLRSAELAAWFHTHFEHDAMDVVDNCDDGHPTHHVYHR